MPIDYPKPRRDDSVVEDYHGTQVADPYRWMEDPDGEETQEWVNKANKVTTSYFEEHCKLREPLKERLTEGYNFPKYSCSYKRGDFYYFSKNDGLQNQSVMYQQRTIDGEPEVFIDPNKLSDDGTAAFRSKAFSEDGSLMAYGISRSGSDWQTIYVMDAKTKKQLPDKVEWSKFSGISWLHDNSGFFFCRYDPPKSLENDDAEKDAKRGSEVDKAQNQQVYFHKLGTPQSEDVRVFAWPEQPDWMFGAEVSDDGKYLLITPSDGCLPVNRLFYVNLEETKSLENVEPVKLIDNFDAEYSYITNEGTAFWFKTNLNAPKYKIIKIDLTKPEQENWEEVVPESEDVLTFACCANKDKLVLCYMHHVKEVLQVSSMDGKKLMDIDLPDLGSVLQLCARKEDAEMFYMFSSFVYPSTIYRFDFDKLESKLFRATEVPGHDPSEFETRQEFYPSKDGTRIPMFIVSKKGVQKTGDNPVYLYGYGGFSISLTPSFSVFRTTFIKSFNSILAIPNIRGGGEYGEDWHCQAIIEKRQTAFDDFIGAAEYLISEKYTNPEKICISGGSNGGLLVSTVANQRPDLYKCVVSQVPVTDMLRFHKFTIGHAWCTDFGCADKENDFKALHKYSPLHNVVGGRQYPAILVTTADHDDRVVPLHSLKYVATLHNELGSSNELPLLIRVDVKAGHGAGKPTAKVIEEVADIYAFIGHILGLELQS